MTRIVGFIPAKGSSTRVPSKNKQRVRGVPLFLWAANNLSRVLKREDIFIDSEDEGILNEAKKLGFGTLARPAELASNATGGNQLMAWQASQVQADVYVQHLPPMLFLRESTLRQTVEAVLGEFDSAFGVMSEHLYLWDKDGPRYDIKNIPNSFTLPLTCVETMGLYAVRADAFAKEGVRVAGRSKRIELSRYEAIDIDYPDDLEFARVVAEALPADHELVRGIGELGTALAPKLVCLDVDGVLTDGGIYLDGAGVGTKRFNAKDGIAIRRLIAAGVEVAIVTGSPDAAIIGQRAELLGIKKDMVVLSAKDKLGEVQRLAARFGLAAQDVLFVGDDINDLQAMAWAGLACCPSDAALPIKRVATSVLSRRGGEGCVAEVLEGVLRW